MSQSKRAKRIAESMADYALSHSRESFKVYGSRDAMLKQFQPYAEIIAELESVASRNAENIERSNVLIDHSRMLMEATGMGNPTPDFVPREWS